MSITLHNQSSQSVSGLGTSTFTVVTAGTYDIECKSTIPLGSGLSIVINQNADPVVSVTGPSASQLSSGASATILAAATDTITVVLSSSNAVDSVPNAVKSVITLFQRF